MIDRDRTRLFDDWIAELERRHLSSLTPSEVARALRALSSCYVERRDRLAEGQALAGSGKRAAFALVYAPLHFLVTQQIVRALPVAGRRVRDLHDLGCGTGAAGAAWALEHDGVRLTGIDRHPWAVAEANWTYRRLGVTGRARRGDISRLRLPSRRGTGILAAYVVNELGSTLRDELLERLLRAHATGATILLIEAIARSLTPWWGQWAAAVQAAGGREDEWRFPATLPARPRTLAKAAGLDIRELTARSLLLA